MCSKLACPRHLVSQVARRSQNAHAIVNAAFAVVLEGNVVKGVRAVYGGIRAGATRAPHTEAALLGHDITKQVQRRNALSPKGTNCAPPTYVGKVLSSVRESSSQHTCTGVGLRWISAEKLY